MKEYDDNKLLGNLRSASKTVVYNALVYIRTKYIKQSDGVKQFCILGGIKLLLNLVEKTKFTDIVLSILGNCCADNTGRNEVILQNGVPVLARIFLCLASESIQNRVCRTLANICLSKEGIEAVTKESVFSHILSFLKSTKNVECQQTALRAVRIIASNCDKATLYREKGIASAAEFLTSENVNVLKAAVKAVSCLTHRCTTECAQKVLHQIPLLVELCSHHEENVSEQALTSLVNLCYVPAIRPELGKAGAIPLFVRIINEKKKTDISSVTVALSFCSREVNNRKRILDCHAYETLFSVLEQPATKALHRHIIACFLSFQYDTEGLTTLLDCGLIPTLINQLNLFVGENKKEHLQLTAESILASGSTTRKRNFFDKAMMSFDESYTTIKPVLSDDDDDGNDAENEEDKEVACMMEGLVTRKTVRGAKVFCIHSPSYQEVQNELPRNQDYTGKEVFYGDVRSPSSVVSYCHSPDRVSLDWSNPSSPDRASLCSPSSSAWSGVYSFRASSPEFSDGEALSPTPSTNTDSLSYSPICDFSDEEPIPKSVDCNSNISSVKSKETLELTQRKCFKRRRSDTKRNRKKYKEECLVPEDSASVPEMEKEDSRREQSIDNTGEHIIVLLSHLSQIKEHRTHVATKPCLQAILDCLRELPYIIKRAERILLRITRQYDLFEDMVSFGIVPMILHSLKEIHDLSNCGTCQRLKRLRNELLTNMRIVAESKFGYGELRHMLLRGTPDEWVQCVLAIAYLVKSQSSLQKLLDYPMLEKMAQLPAEEPAQLPMIISSLLELCSPWCEENVAAPASTVDECLYSGSVSCSDVHFQLDDGSRISAKRSLLSQRSEYFRAMLDGYFRESKEIELALPLIHKTVAELVFHHLYGCLVDRCPKFTLASQEEIMELLEASDRFLLSSLEQQITERLVSTLTPETVVQVYKCGCKYEKSKLRVAAVKFLLLRQQNREKVSSCFEKLYQSQDIKDSFILDIIQFVNKLLQELNDTAENF